MLTQPNLSYLKSYYMDSYKNEGNEPEESKTEKTLPEEFINIEDTSKYQNENEFNKTISLECLFNTDENVILFELKKVLDFLDNENSIWKLDHLIIERVIDILRSGKCSYKLAKYCVDIIEYICIQDDQDIHDNLHLGFLEALLDVISVNRYANVVASALNSYHCAIYNNPLTSSEIDGEGFVSATIFVLSIINESPEKYITFIPKDDNEEEEEVNEAENEEVRLSELIMKCLILASDALSFFSVDEYQTDSFLSNIFQYLDSNLISSNCAAVRAISTVAYYNAEFALFFFSESDFIAKCVNIAVECPLGIKYFAISCLNNLCSLDNSICSFIVTSPILSEVFVSEEWSLKAIRALAKLLSTLFIGIKDDFESIKIVETNTGNILDNLFAIVTNCDAKTREFGDDALFSLICLGRDSINRAILEGDIELADELIACVSLQVPEIIEMALKASIVLAELCERNSNEAFAQQFMNDVLNDDYESALDSVQMLYPSPSNIAELAESIRHYLEDEE